MPHKKFILESPIEENLATAIQACSSIGDGIETFAVCDYIMQSVFLKMTGFQEQKMKCICWSLATSDFEYRYDKFRKGIGECSLYRDKNDLYKDIIKKIKKYKETYNFEEKTRQSILDATKKIIQSYFEKTNLYRYGEKKFLQFLTIWEKIEDSTICTITKDSGALFSTDKSTVYKIYESLYRNRNRIAHNVLSYQQNLPLFGTLRDDAYQYENYFLWFALLIVIDKIFIHIYKNLIELSSIYYHN